MSVVAFKPCGAGLFSYLGGVAEWLYCLSTGEASGLIIADEGFYRSGPTSLCSLLFQEPGDPRVHLGRPASGTQGEDAIHYPTQITCQDFVRPRDLRYVHCGPGNYELDYFHTYQTFSSPSSTDTSSPFLRLWNASKPCELNSGASRRLASISAAFSITRVLGQ